MTHNREIVWKSAFKDDYKREKRGKYRHDIDQLMAEFFGHIFSGLPLPQRYNDHKLAGKWVGFRECHLKPNLLVTYRKPSHNVLELYRLGSHSELELS
ncbi:MAG: type II toxin-antitoxin system YafQ family toxin [Candidatus Symbiobacter sp.]|nr:type II toxin-antitoxin system YafQ family toxin [Candidatus Symbiobacter sp.]